jgi:hypothetical protein
MDYVKYYKEDISGESEGIGKWCVQPKHNR